MKMSNREQVLQSVIARVDQVLIFSELDRPNQDQFLQALSDMLDVFESMQPGASEEEMTEVLAMACFSLFFPDQRDTLTQ